MFSRCLKAVLLLAVLPTAAAVAAKPLRICADPDNLPFSDQAGRGFDNRIAALVARDVGREPLFIPARSRRGFLREQFNKGACDLLTGVPLGMRGVLTTRPYYRSTYLFITPAREHLQIASFQDPHLNGRRIGLQILEEDYSPPSLPLIRNGHAAQLVGFDAFGRGGNEIIRAVADGRVDIAVVWGPVAGYFAGRQHVPLTLMPVAPAVDSSGVPLAYSIAFAVHRNDGALRDALNASFVRLEPQIQKVLAAYHVPTLPQTRGAL
ncbi:MAG: quinoprotein dehydrogenase-associated putative ABC transporter substrate-binding protein [Candidatus Sulfotelmatobacter sp.]